MYKIIDVNDDNNTVVVKENITLEESKQFARDFWESDAKDLCNDLDELSEGESYPIGCGYIVTKN
jgi:hypothetical protein